MNPRYRLRIARAEFRFAAAHFTLFEDREAENLHGHNYRVAIEVEGPALRADGLLVEIAGLKRAVRELCARWDDRVLLPARSTEVSIRERNGHVEVTYREREYRFPTREVVLLDLVNTTIELLARQLWEDLRPVLANSKVDRLTVAVEEIEGQAGSYEAALRTV